MNNSTVNIKTKILALIIDVNKGMIRVETEFGGVVVEVWALFEIDNKGIARPYASNWDGEADEWMIVWSAIAGRIC